MFASVRENKGCLREVSYFKLLSDTCHCFSKDIGVIPLTRYGFSSGDGHLWFSIGCIAYKIGNIFLSTCGVCSEVVFDIGWRATYFGLLRAKLILAPLGMPKWVWPSMNWYRTFFVQTSTLPPSMHQKHTEHGRCCMLKTTNTWPKVMLS